MSAFAAGRLPTGTGGAVPTGIRAVLICRCGETCADLPAWLRHRAEAVMTSVHEGCEATGIVMALVAHDSHIVRA